MVYGLVNLEDKYQFLEQMIWLIIYNKLKINWEN